MVGGTQTNLSRVHAEHGQVFVVAASHLIFLFRQPLQARITKRGQYYVYYDIRWDVIPYPLVACVGYVHQQIHNLHPGEEARISERQRTRNALNLLF